MIDVIILIVLFIFLYINDDDSLMWIPFIGLFFREKITTWVRYRMFTKNDVYAFTFFMFYQLSVSFLIAIFAILYLILKFL